MADQLTDNFENIFDKLLSGLRKKHGCQTLMLKIVEDWRYALDKKQIVGAILMDLSKAFANKLLESYLTMEKQRVKLGQTQSEWHELLKGVPQGSILGPLLFNIFMNDMYYCINECQLYGYADDDSILV